MILLILLIVSLYITININLFAGSLGFFFVLGVGYSCKKAIDARAKPYNKENIKNTELYTKVIHEINTLNQGDYVRLRNLYNFIYSQLKGDNHFPFLFLKPYGSFITKQIMRETLTLIKRTHALDNNQSLEFSEKISATRYIEVKEPVGDFKVRKV